MKGGDRVLVYDTPGHPLHHWIFARVLAPQENGAMVEIDHPGNPQHGRITFVPADKIRTKEDLPALAKTARDEAGRALDTVRRQELLGHARMYEEQAELVD